MDAFETRSIRYSPYQTLAADLLPPEHVNGLLRPLQQRGALDDFLLVRLHYACRQKGGYDLWLQVLLEELVLHNASQQNSHTRDQYMAALKGLLRT